MIVKTCKTHGPLTLEQVKVEPGITKPYYRCRQCFQAQDLAYWRKNKEQKLTKARAYKRENRAQMNAYKRKESAELTDYYVKRSLSPQLRKHATPDLIDFKRLLLLIKRAIKDRQQQKFEPKSEGPALKALEQALNKELRHKTLDELTKLSRE